MKKVVLFKDKMFYGGWSSTSCLSIYEKLSQRNPEELPEKLSRVR